MIAGTVKTVPVEKFVEELEATEVATTEVAGMGLIHKGKHRVHGEIILISLPQNQQIMIKL